MKRLVLACLVVGCSNGAPEVSGTKLARGVDATGQYPSVVKLRDTTLDPAYFPVACTASFIAPRVLLLASHCVNNETGDWPRLVVGAAGGEVPLDRVYMNSHFNDPPALPGETDDDLLTQPYRAFDQAVAVLDHDLAPAVVPVASAVPAVFPRALLVGFGYSDFTIDDQGVPDVHGNPGTTRAGTTPVTYVGRLIHTETNLTDQTQDVAIGAGDSGGPMFTMDAAGHPVAEIGVASGAGARAGGIAVNLHVDLTSQESRDFFAWLAAAPRCVEAGGATPTPDCTTSNDDGRIPYPR